MMPSWNGRTRISAFVAVALAVFVVLLTLQWSSILVGSAGVLAVALAALSLQDGLPAGSCPSCRAKPRRQQRDEVAGSVQLTSLGWTVALTVDRLCTNCRESRHLVEEFVVPRESASTEAEALVLARSGRYLPERIRTTS